MNAINDFSGVLFLFSALLINPFPDAMDTVCSDYSVEPSKNLCIQRFILLENRGLTCIASPDTTHLPSEEPVCA